ncbi:MAG: T9SS type A sorting domain-containing protein, partial [Flavobacteriales bacterium]
VLSEWISDTGEPMKEQGRVYLASMGIYTFNRKVLFDLLKLEHKEATDFGKEIIHRFRFETNLVSAVAETPNRGIRLYPNPTRGLVHLDLMGFDRTVAYTLYDGFGRKIEAQSVIRKSGTETFELSLENQPEGVYFVEINDARNRATARIVKLN